MDKKLFSIEVKRIREKPDNSNIATIVLETEKDEQGFIPCMVKEGEQGYHRTDWHWNTDLETARKLAQDRNDLVNLSMETVEAIVFCSMF